MNASLSLIAWFQVALGVAVVVAGWLLVAHGVDNETPWRRRLLLCGLVLWGLLFAWQAWSRGPDSLPANAFAALVVYVLVAHPRVVRDFINRR